MIELIGGLSVIGLMAYFMIRVMKDEEAEKIRRSEERKEKKDKHRIKNLIRKFQRHYERKK